jgi:hypothetical protein
VTIDEMGGLSTMARPDARDEDFIHQSPELLATPLWPSPFWRESYFFELHSPDAGGDVLFFTMALHPNRQLMDSIQMGRIGGEQILGVLSRSTKSDPQTTRVPGASVEVVRAFEQIRLQADPEIAVFGCDLEFRARTQPYGLRRGTMRAADGIVWDQSHILQSGSYHGSYTHNGVKHDVDGWVGQRDHSWGVRDHGRCPLWLWFQVQFEDGFLGVWHWELANGARIYTDGCWAGADRSAPVPVVDFTHSMNWTGPDGSQAEYGTSGEGVSSLTGHCSFTLADGRTVNIDATGTFDRPYEPFHRGGLSQMQVRADDGRQGSAIFEITGARHHRYFPDTSVDGLLPE